MEIQSIIYDERFSISSGGGGGVLLRIQDMNDFIVI